MNNYSFLQKLLHKLALGSQMMRETAFDIEVALFGKDLPPFSDHHVFVAGLARSGTTILLNAIYETDEFASLSYEDMPFILSPMFWKTVHPNIKHTEAVERAHGDRIKVSTNSPEAFEEVFWKTFGESDQEIAEKFKKYIQLILKKKNKSRYLSKNNQNIRRLRFLNSTFPNSTILIPFRAPLQHANSLLSQHQRFTIKQTEDKFTRQYMKFIGHSEFGLDYLTIASDDLSHPDPQTLDHWLEQWLKVYQKVYRLVSKDKAIHLICYELLCSQPQVWSIVQEVIGVQKRQPYHFDNKPKEINVEFQQSLVDQCEALYSKLRSHSLGLN